MGRFEVDGPRKKNFARRTIYLSQGYWGQSEPNCLLIRPHNFDVQAEIQSVRIQSAQKGMHSLPSFAVLQDDAWSESYLTNGFNIANTFGVAGTPSRVDTGME